MEIVLVMGYPASGKSTWAAQRFPGHRRINRDSLGDMTTDRTFAERVGVRFVDQAAFFA